MMSGTLTSFLLIVVLYLLILLCGLKVDANQDGMDKQQEMYGTTVVRFNNEYEKNKEVAFKTMEATAGNNSGESKPNNAANAVDDNDDDASASASASASDYNMYVVKYNEQWPNCDNLQCIQKQPLSFFENACNNNNECLGFTFPSKSVSLGSGCLKQNKYACATNGFDQGMFNYYEKQVVGTTFVKKYTDEWPNCENLECLSNENLEYFENACNNNNQCVGFSLGSDSVTSTTGCLKHNQNHICDTNGFGQGGHDYYEKQSVAIKYEKQYIGEWPNCENLQCLPNQDIEFLQVECNHNPSCLGFSYTSNQVTGGSGCLKHNQDACNNNGMEHGSFDYFRKYTFDTAACERVCNSGNGRNCELSNVCTSESWWNLCETNSLQDMLSQGKSDANWYAVCAGCGYSECNFDVVQCEAVCNAGHCDTIGSCHWDSWRTLCTTHSLTEMLENGKSNGNWYAVCAGCGHPECDIYKFNVGACQAVCDAGQGRDCDAQNQCETETWWGLCATNTAEEMASKGESDANWYAVCAGCGYSYCDQIRSISTSDLTNNQAEMVSEIQNLQDESIVIADAAKDSTWIEDIGLFIGADLLHLEAVCDFLMETLMPMLKQAWEGTVDAFNAFIDAAKMAGAVAGEIRNAIRQGVQATAIFLEEIASEAWRATRQAALQAYAQLHGWATDVYDLISSTEMYSYIENAAKVIVHGFAQLGDELVKLGGKLKNIGEEIGDFFVGLWEDIRDWDDDDDHDHNHNPNHPNIYFYELYDDHGRHLGRRRVILSKYDYYYLKYDPRWQQDHNNNDHRRRRRLIDCDIPDPNQVFGVIATTFNNVADSIHDKFNQFASSFVNDDHDHDHANAMNHHQSDDDDGHDNDDYEYDYEYHHHDNNHNHNNNYDDDDDDDQDEMGQIGGIYQVDPWMYQYNSANGGTCTIQPSSGFALKINICGNIKLSLFEGSICLGVVFDFTFVTPLILFLWEWSVSVSSDFNSGISLGIGVSMAFTGGASSFLGSGIELSASASVDPLGVAISNYLQCGSCVGTSISLLFTGDMEFYGTAFVIALGINESVKPSLFGPIVLGGAYGYAYQLSCTWINACSQCGAAPFITWQSMITVQC